MVLQVIAVAVPHPSSKTLAPPRRQNSGTSPAPPRGGAKRWHLPGGTGQNAGTSPGHLPGARQQARCSAGPLSPLASPMATAFTLKRSCRPSPRFTICVIEDGLAVIAVAVPHPSSKTLAPPRPFLAKLWHLPGRSSSFQQNSGTSPGAPPRGTVDLPSVVDRLNPKLLESSEVVPHRMMHVGRVALPIRVLGDDPQRLSRAIGLGLSGHNPCYSRNPMRCTASSGAARVLGTSRRGRQADWGRKG